MTAKRFNKVKVYLSYEIFDNDNNKQLDVDSIVDLLNKLNDENEQLKYNLSAHMVDLNNDKGKCSALEIENEQLKFQLRNISDQRDEFHRGARENANRVGKLEKENEQLQHDATILILSNQDYRKENEQLKEDNNALIHLLENQSMIIQELHSKLLEYQIQEPIVLTKEDLKLMGKAISYYTHGRYAE